MRQFIFAIAISALAGCGADTMSGAATVATLKKQELEQGKQKIGQAMQQMEQGAKRAGDAATN